MRASVRAAFVEFSTKFEGCVPHMYLDVKNLVTCAIGNLIDTVAEACALPFLKADGTKATHAEIEAEWHNINSHTELSHRGGFAFGAVASLHLDAVGIQQAVSTKLASIEAHLKSRFPQFEEWPADAQLGLLSMAWAAGPAFKAPHFIMAALAKDFEGCSLECHLSEIGNPGLKPRNIANRQLFMNASYVQIEKRDPEILYYPDAPPPYAAA